MNLYNRTNAGAWRLRRAALAAMTALTVALWCGGERAQASFVITPTFDSSITSDPNAAAIEGTINTAIGFYEATFTNNITVNINFLEMTSGLGQSSTFFANVSYSDYLAALQADQAAHPGDANKATAFSHLPAGPANPVNGNMTINVKTANLRAVGINVNPPVDGSIGLNTHITTPGSPGGGPFSLLAVTEHEIDEVLGLGSALPNFPLSTIFPEDLYRYDQSGNRSFTTNSSAKAFFSIDGTTDIAQFDNQNDGGDFGDWQSNPLPPGVSPKVQDAFATPGANPSLSLTSPEVTALDVIGYDLAGQSPPAAPEPSSLALFGVGSLLLTGYGWRLRHRRRAAMLKA